VLGDKIYGEREAAYLDFIERGWTPELARELILPRHALHACGLEFDDGQALRLLAIGLPRDLAGVAEGKDACDREVFG
jgi:23S rRNA pseudouridine1911/1915/1917 synthase